MRFVVACLAAMVGEFRKGLVGEMRVMDPLLRVREGVWIMRITFSDWDREQSCFWSEY